MVERVVNFKGYRPEVPQPTGSESAVATEDALDKLPYGGKLTQLEKGYDSDGSGYPDLDSYKSAWNRHRDEIMKHWSQESRPAAWWVCDCEFYDQLELEEHQVGPNVFGVKIPQKNEQAAILQQHLQTA